MAIPWIEGDLCRINPKPLGGLPHQSEDWFAMTLASYSFFILLEFSKSGGYAPQQGEFSQSDPWSLDEGWRY